MSAVEKILSLASHNPRQWPEIKSVHCGETNAEFELYIPVELIWLKGHFPSQPVVPGVVQVHWAAELCKTVFGLVPPFRSVENLKFQTMILPDIDVNLQMSFVADKGRVDFRYFNSETLFSEGKLRFAE